MAVALALLRCKTKCANPDLSRFKDGGVWLFDRDLALAGLAAIQPVQILERKMEDRATGTTNNDFAEVYFGVGAATSVPTTCTHQKIVLCRCSITAYGTACDLGDKRRRHEQFGRGAECFSSVRNRDGREPPHRIIEKSVNVCNWCPKVE